MGGHSSKGLFPGVSKNAGLSNNSISENKNLVEETRADDVVSGNGTTREQLINEASTKQVRSIIKELYRYGATTGDGGTADAIREQKRSKKLVGGRDHIQKGRERLRQIEKLLKQNPNHPDRQLLEKLKADLRNALGDSNEGTNFK